MCGILLQILSSSAFTGLVELLKLCQDLKIAYTDNPQQVSLLTNQSMLNFDELVPLIEARGPDNFGSLEISCYEEQEVKEASFKAKMGASVLSLRGEGLTKQPIQSEKGVLLYNGQVYSAWPELEYNPALNDGLQLLKHLDVLASNYKEQQFREEMQMLLFNKIQGQFAVVYYSKVFRSIFIAKDSIGRRSLLVSANKDLNSIQITSVIPSGIVFQIPNGCLIRINAAVSFTPPSKLSSLRFSPISETTPKSFILSHYQQEMDETMTNFLSQWQIQKYPHYLYVSLLLYGAVRSRILNITSQKGEAAQVAILFSGGIDSTLLAIFTHFALPNHFEINLVNISFDPTDSPDRLTSILGLHELKRLV